ncbi:Alpha crystallin/Hsp20 domain [Dillenia turbinata]|uniref:Alpha crystallin/Hsp20 domain n=1 Tax=Dillenia turbinata TaxID=194707 RepID=A0AAN8YUG6_9MAGN
MSKISQLFNNTPLSFENWEPNFLALVRNCPVLNTPIDWKETPEGHVFMVDLPGLRKEDVKVEVDEQRVLHISGERKVESDEKNETWHRVERDRGPFHRRFRLPENAKVDEVKASMQNGVLLITVAKQEIKKPQPQIVEIKEIKG